MDDEPMWTADRVVSLTRGPTITIPKTTNEFAIKGNHLTLVKRNQFDRRIKTDPHKHVHEFLGVCDMFKYKETENKVVRLMMFPLSLTGEAKTRRFDALLDERSEILHSIEGTIFEEKLCAGFNEFVAMTADENSESESDEKEPKFEKITFDTDYKIKTSLEEPPSDLELKPLHDNLEYVFLEEPSFLPVIISSQLYEQNKKGIVLGHKVFEAGLEVNKAKIDIISKLLPHTNIKDPCLSFHITFAMSTQQDIYAAGSESRPPMLNKENYVPWSSCLLRYAKSRPNGKLIHNSIINGPYVRRMIPELEADDQAIQTNLLGLPEDIYAAEKKAKLFNEWEMFTSNEGESIEFYYNRFLKLMNDLKRNKHFPKKIASNLKFLKTCCQNGKEVDELKAERLAKIQDPLALMANSNNPYAFSAPHQDQPSFNQNYMQQPMPNPNDITDPTTAMNMALALMAKAFKLIYSTLTNNNQRISSNPRNRQITQPRMNMGQDRQMQMVRECQELGCSEPRVQNIGNQNGLIGVLGNANQNGNGNLVAARAEGNATGHNGNQIRCYNCRGVGYFAEEFDLIAAAADLDEIEEVNANCILMANLQQASTSSTQTDKAPVYDSDESVEVHDYGNCYDNEIFNMFTQKEQYTKLLEPIPAPHQVPQNDNNVISEVTSVKQSGEIVEQHPANFEEMM
uniref:Reverse transcriptase domain-containing protein n=1 Tax=Tanacetum cinerariifolium TaxID=118510 RepID=A0A6L2LRL8_TANCI|nr:reverse transcriptase domain-containing protein [Tanacetum cinerariifolium]